MDNEEKQTQYYLADIDTIIPYARNARTHSKEQIAQIAASIKEFGFLSPIVVSDDNTILCGHGRYYAAQQLGLKKIPCVKEKWLTDAQKRAYTLADNQLALNAGWDEDMLSVELSDLQADVYDLSLLGFDDKELEKLMMNPDDTGAKDDDFDLTAALEKASFVEKGDLWTVGKHRLLCGDATFSEDVDTLMGDKTANLIVTDPPYGVSFKASDGLTIENDSLKGDEFYQFLLAAFTNMADHLEKGGAAYVFHADTEGLNFRKAFIDAGFHLAGVCIWVKNSLVLGRSDYQWQHEPILYGFLQNGRHPWYSDRKQTTIWNFDKPKRNKDHPTSKPLDLLSYPIKNSSQENAIVLDTFGGSGSTMMACEQMNRTCMTMELDPKYASVILRRYVEDTGDSEHVFVERGGKKIPYSDLVKEVETA
jgi:DNA modification methylase